MNNYERLDTDLDFQASMADLILSAYVLSHKLNRKGAENIKYARALITNESYRENKWVELMMNFVCHDPSNIVLFRKRSI